MPKFGDYGCPTCNFVAREVPVPFGTSFNAEVVECPFCDSDVTVPDGGPRITKGTRMDWLPAIGRMSAGNGPTFTKFDVHDGRGNLVTVDSISALRKIESESEKMAADGVGQRMVWRDLANDKSNKDQHAYHKDWVADDYPGAPTAEGRALLKPLTDQILADRQKDAVAPLQLPSDT